MNVMKQRGAFWLAMLLANLAFAASKSPLADAVEKTDRTSIRTLIEQHADVNAPQADGKTAPALGGDLNDLETARLLVKAAADVKATNH
jgi:hypothetical protein